MLIKRNIILKDCPLSRLGVPVEQAIDQVPFEDGLLYYLRNIFLMNPDIVDAFGIDHNQGPLFTKTRTAGLLDLDLIFQILFLNIILKGLDHRPGAQGQAASSGTDRHQGLCSVSLGLDFRSELLQLFD